MNIIQELNQAQLVRRLMGMDSNQVKNAFFANYLGALVMLRMQDLKGLMLVNDPSHIKLKKFENGMSDLCFWGRALFYPEDKLVKGNLQYGHADILAKESGRIFDAQIEKIMRVVLTSPDQVNWNDAVAKLVLLRHRFEMNSSYFDKIARSLYKWDTLNDGARRKAVGDAFMYLMQADNKSTLLTRMRELAGSTMRNDLQAMASKFISIGRLKEDGESVAGGGGTSAGNIGTTSGGSNNAIISRGAAPSISGQPKASDTPETHDQMMARNMKFPSRDENKGKKKLIKKRLHRFKVIKFKAPSHLQVKKGDK